MTKIYKSIITGSVTILLPFAWSASAMAAVTSDYIYIHCPDSDQDIRISELNHKVSQFSDKYQQYRPMCPDCDISEWGNRITMKDGARTFVQINRITGYIYVQRSDARNDASPFDIRSFRGTCAKGNMVTPNVTFPAAGRVF
jgi:hypothetical protein